MSAQSVSPFVQFVKIVESAQQAKAIDHKVTHLDKKTTAQYPSYHPGKALADMPFHIAHLLGPDIYPLNLFSPAFASRGPAAQRLQPLLTYICRMLVARQVVF